jgi:hypothetical protein
MESQLRVVRVDPVGVKADGKPGPCIERLLGHCEATINRGLHESHPEGTRGLTAEISNLLIWPTTAACYMDRYYYEYFSALFWV